MEIPSHVQTSDAIIKDVRQLYTSERRQNGLLVFAPNESHVCTNACQFYEHRTPDAIVFLCKKSLMVHFCGKQCGRSFLSAQQEGYVCELTGFVVGEPPSIAYSRKSKDAFSKTKFLGDNFMRMGTRTPRQKKDTNSPSIRCTCFEKALEYVLCGPDRVRVFSTHKKKYLKEVSAELYRLKRSGQSVDLQEMSRAIHCTYQSNKHLLNPPCDYRDTQINALSRAIFVYYQKFRGLKKTSKVAHAFVGVCISKLRDGYTSNGVVVFKKNAYVARYAPSDIQFGLLPGFHCRHMSILWRKMLSEILSPVTNTPKLGMIFEL